MLREELAKVIVLSIIEGFVNEASILEVIPFVINTKLVGPIMPITENFFFLPFTRREDVHDVVKLKMIRVKKKDGPCSLKLAYWSAELGDSKRAAVEGQ